MDEPIKIMFVCLGNICRSPLAEHVFRDVVQDRGLEDCFEIASSGTGDWHVDEQADRRMRATAKEQGLSLEAHRGQQFATADLGHYDHVFVMDKENLHDVLYLDEEEQYSGKVRLFREFDPEPGDYQVPDPYYGGEQGFQNVYGIVERTARKLLERFIEEYELEERERVGENRG